MLCAKAERRTTPAPVLARIPIMVRASGNEQLETPSSTAQAHAPPSGAAYRPPKAIRPHTARCEPLDRLRFRHGMDTANRADVTPEKQTVGEGPDSCRQVIGYSGVRVCGLPRSVSLAGSLRRRPY